MDKSFHIKAKVPFRVPFESSKTLGGEQGGSHAKPYDEYLQSYSFPVSERDIIHHTSGHSSPLGKGGPSFGFSSTLFFLPLTHPLSYAHICTGISVYLYENKLGGSRICGSTEIPLSKLFLSGTDGTDEFDFEETLPVINQSYDQVFQANKRRVLKVALVSAKGLPKPRMDGVTSVVSRGFLYSLFIYLLLFFNKTFFASSFLHQHYFTLARKYKHSHTHSYSQVSTD